MESKSIIIARTVFIVAVNTLSDNDSKHKSKSTKEWMSRNGMLDNVMQTPASSPDLNPMENVWSPLKYYLQRTIKTKKKDELVNGAKILFFLHIIFSSPELNAQGMYLEMYGPTLIDLKILYNTNYETVARAVTGRGSGGFIGSLIGGVLVHRYEGKLDLLVGLPLMLAAVAVFFVPLAPDINAVWGLVNITGVVGGMLSIALTRQLVLMWKEKAASYILLRAIGYPIGALLVPMVCRPFLAEIDFGNSEEKEGAEDTEGTYHVLKESNVQTAYLIVAVLAFFSALPFLLFQLMKQADPPVQHETVSPEDLDYAGPAYVKKPKMTLLSATGFLILILYFNIGGGGSVFSVFIRSLGADIFHFSTDESSNLNILFWISMTVSRIVGTVATSVIHIKTLVTFQCSFHVLASTLVKLFAASSHRALWACTLLMGVAQATMHSSGLAYLNFRLDMDAKCLMLINFGSYFGDLTFVWVSGKIYDLYGPASILNLVMAASIAGLIIIIVLRVRERHDSALKEQPTDVMT